MSKNTTKPKKNKEGGIPELDQLKAVTAGMKKMAKELKNLKKENKALKAELKKSKKKNKKKKKEVITSVMEPQVLPPAEPKAKKSKKGVSAETISTSKIEEKPAETPAGSAPKTEGKTKVKGGRKAKVKSIAPAKAETKPAAEKVEPSEVAETPQAAEESKAPEEPKATAKSKGAAKNKATASKSKTASKSASATASNRPAGPEDLRFVQGLGAKIESLLNEKGVKTFADLAKASPAKVKDVLSNAGPRFVNQDPKPLIEQAKLINAEKWAKLEAYQAELMEGRAKPGPKAGSKRKKGS